MSIIPHTLMFTLTCTLEYTQTTQTERTHTNSKKETKVLKQPGQDKIREF